MMIPAAMQSGRFCWVDLAARDAGRAAAFYRELFGWAACPQRVGKGHFTRLLNDDIEVGSLYQLSQKQLDLGVPSHWTPYVAVTSLDAASGRATSLGGRMVVRSFHVPGIARIGLLMDPGGALIGLWQPIDRCDAAGAHRD